MNKKYWLRGGIGLFIIDAIGSIIYFCLYNLSQSLGSQGIGNPLLPQKLLLSDISKIFSYLFLLPYFVLQTWTPIPSSVCFIINFLIYFIIGVFLGWFYRKNWFLREHFKMVVSIIAFILFVCIFYFVYSNHLKNQKYIDLNDTFLINKQGEGAIQIGENGNKFIYRNGQWQPY